MAHRPIFIAGNLTGPLFKEVSIQFKWHPGLAASQRRKCVHSLHEAAKDIGCPDILEVSTKSGHELGRRLSAFRLDVSLSQIKTKIECMYQGAKVFEKGGPFPELFKAKPIEAKRFFKQKDLGLIKWFDVGGTLYENLPFHAFYDWLFLRALSQHQDFLREGLAPFSGFSDIEFNPARSINTQARTIAIIKTLIARRELDRCAEDYNYFRSFLSQIQSENDPQIELGIAS